MGYFIIIYIILLLRITIELNQHYLSQHYSAYIVSFIHWYINICVEK